MAPPDLQSILTFLDHDVSYLALCIGIAWCLILCTMSDMLAGCRDNRKVQVAVVGSRVNRNMGSKIS